MFDRDFDASGHLVPARTDDPPPAGPALARQTPRRPAPVHRSRVAPADPATRVMTDFCAQAPVWVTAERPIDEALRDMMVAGVRALLVIRGESVIGLITSYAIQGARPMQFLHEAGFTRHDEIQVGHVMTPWDRVPTLEWEMVRAASVQDIAEQFRSRRATTHIVVLERSESGAASVRGLFSRTQLERQLEA